MRSNSRSIGQGVVFVVGATALVGLVPIWLTDWPLTAPSALILLTLALAGLRMSWLIAEGAPRLMEFSTWSFVYVFFGLAPLVQVQTKRWPSTTPNVYVTYLEPATWLIIVSCVAAFIGVLATNENKGPAQTPNERSLSRTRTLTLAFIAIALNLVFLVRTGPSAFLQSRFDLRNAQVAAWGSDTMYVVVGAVCTMPSLVALVALIRLRQKSARHDRSGMNVLILVLATILLYTVNPISSPRYYFGTVILALAAATGAYATPGRVRVTAVTLITGLVIIFPIADAFRASTSDVDLSISPENSLTSGDYDGLVQTTNTIRYVDLEGLTNGRQALGVILFWVPRDLWPDKPEDSATLVAGYAGYDFLNLSAPLWSELYLNGGWIVAILGMLGYGVFIRHQDNLYVRQHTLGRPASPLMDILPFYLLILLRGSLLQAMSYFVLILATAWFVSTTERPRKGRVGVRVKRAGQ